MVKVSIYWMKITVVILLCFACYLKGNGQNNYHIIFRTIDKDSLYLSKNLPLQTGFLSYTQASQYIDKVPALLQSKGYISASIDSISQRDTETEIFLFLGEKYEIINLRISQGDRYFLQRAGVNMFKQKNILSFSQYQSLSAKLLDNFENTGYPFAQVKLDSVSVNGSAIEAALSIDKGSLYHIDSIRLSGPAKISPRFIQLYLGIKAGSLYSKELLNKIDQRLLELPYLELMQSWDMTMLNTGSLINLYLKPKRSNQINILAGFLPSNQQVGGKLLFTIDANLQLKNAFGSGESIGLVWQQIQPKSPKINLAYTQPYIFNSPLGIDFSFDLFKRDSSFVNINGQMGLIYIISSNKTAKIIFQTQRTNMLQIDTVAIKLAKQLPDIADVSSANLGIDYSFSNTDYKFNPRRGNEFSITLLTGSKNIRKNNGITQLKDASFDYNSLYDSIKLKSYQVRGRINAAHYFATGKRSVIKTGLNGGFFESANYFRNEMFQIGGYRLLRGFDEESIFTNRYVVGTLEYRYLLDKNSNFFIFTDIGWSHNSIVNQSYNYLGSGIGLSLETKGGVFNISYAVGKRDDLNFSLKQSKIHIGYVSIF